MSSTSIEKGSFGLKNICKLRGYFLKRALKLYERPENKHVSVQNNSEHFKSSASSWHKLAHYFLQGWLKTSNIRIQKTLARRFLFRSFNCATLLYLLC